jgi:hypothetical protein
VNIVVNNRYDIVDSVLDYPALVPIHDEFAPADDQGGNHDDDSEGGGNFVSSQMLTEGESSDGAGDDGHGNSAIIISATLTGVSCGIVLALGVYFARRKKRTKKAAAQCLSMPEVKSDVVGSAAAETKPTAAETRPENDDSSSEEEGYFGTIRVRKCVSPEAHGEEGKMDDMDISTLGDPFVSEHTGRNYSENTVGERYASLSYVRVIVVPSIRGLI